MALTNEQYGLVEREYQNLRLEAQKELDARIREVEDRIPGYEALKRARIDLSLAEAKARLFGGGHTENSGRLAELEKKKAALLQEAGYPADYLEPHFRCSRCGDTGYVNGGKCDCFRRVSMQVLHSDSPLWNSILRENFGSFSLSCFSEEPVEQLDGISVREHMRRMRRQLRDYVRDFGSRRESLLFTGNTGTGKTFLCNCIAGELLEQGYSVLYMTAAEFFDLAARIAFHEAEEGESFAELMDGADLLILDDLGMEVLNRMVQSWLFRMVNERSLKGQATLISTNLDVNGIRERYSERTASRIIKNYKIFRFIGQDLRLSLVQNRRR